MAKESGEEFEGIRTPNPYFLFPKIREFGGGEILLILKKIKKLNPQFYPYHIINL